MSTVDLHVLDQLKLGWGKNPTGLSVTFRTTENNKNEILFTHKIEILCHRKTL